MTRARFAAFVDRALATARERGMTDEAIFQASRRADPTGQGVMPSTFHRWRRGEVRTAPKIDKVRAFCAATGANLVDALNALGITGQRDNAEPPVPDEEDVRLIKRRLRDPNTSIAEKLVIRATLRMLAIGGAGNQEREAG